MLCPSCVMQVEAQVHAMPIVCDAGAGKVRVQVLRPSCVMRWRQKCVLCPSSVMQVQAQVRAQVLHPSSVMQVQMQVRVLRPLSVMQVEVQSAVSVGVVEW